MHWNSSLGVSGTCYHDYGKNGVATSILNEHFTPDLLKAEEQFQEHLLQARHELALHTCYMKEQYPEFDLEEADRKACAGYAEHRANIQKGAR